MASNVQITKITLGEYKKQPAPTLKYAETSTPFGNCLAAFNEDVLCFLTFHDDNAPLEKLSEAWPGANLHEDSGVATKITELFDESKCDNIKVLLKGTDFQMQVWEALLTVTKGTTASYEAIAQVISNPKAVRAAANAIAKNNIAYVIPCHRIITKDGRLGKYGGGPQRKLHMLKSEGVSLH